MPKQAPSYERDKKDDGRFVVTHSGSIVGVYYGHPTVRDMAVQTMRVARYNGSLRDWWPVGMHLLHCADIAKSLGGDHVDELHVLLHDSTEVVFSDTPGPVKCKEHREREQMLLTRTYLGLALPHPTKEQTKLVKKVDILSLIAEAEVMGHPAFAAMVTSANNKALLDQEEYDMAKRLLQQRVDTFNPMDALISNGDRVIELRDRIFSAFFQVQQKVPGSK